MAYLAGIGAADPQAADWRDAEDGVGLDPYIRSGIFGCCWLAIGDAGRQRTWIAIQITLYIMYIIRLNY
ncbi:MAG: hypothetical protein ABIS14_00995 [Sphingomonas sp.]